MSTAYSLLRPIFTHPHGEQTIYQYSVALSTSRLYYNSPSAWHVFPPNSSQLLWELLQLHDRVRRLQHHKPSESITFNNQVTGTKTKHPCPSTMLQCYPFLCANNGGRRKYATTDKSTQSSIYFIRVIIHTQRTRLYFAWKRERSQA